MVLRVVPIAEILASMASRESVNVGACSTIPPLPTAFKFFQLKIFWTNHRPVFRTVDSDWLIVIPLLSTTLTFCYCSK